MKKLRLRPVFFIKILLAVFMLAAVFLIIQNFVIRSRQKPRVPIVQEDISQQKIDTTDEIQHFQMRKGKLHLQVKAAKHYIGGDGLYHLEGDVQLTFPGRAEGEDVVLTAREIVHDQNNTYFRMQGEVHLQAKDLSVDSEFLEYQVEKEILRTDFPLRFSSEKISGSAGSAVYHTQPQRLILDQDVEIRLTSSQEPSQPVMFQGDNLDYWHKKGTGTIKGNARIDSGSSRAQAELMRFDLFSNMENLKSIWMQGEVRVVLVENDSSGDEAQAPLQSGGSQREIRAHEILIRAWHNSTDIRSLQAEGHCFLRQDSPAGEHIEILSDRLEINFNQERELKTLHANENVSMQEQREGESRVVRGAALSSEGRKRILHVESQEYLRARIKAGDYEIEADSIDISLESRNLDAQGRVYVIMRSQSDKTPTVGFFTGQGAVFVNADTMRYSGENRRFLFTGGIKVWQGKEMLLTKEMTIIRDSGRLSCRKGVKTFITVQPEADKQERRLDIKSESLEFNPDERRLNYSGDVTLKVDAAQLKADDVFIYLSEEGKKIETLLARGQISIKQGSYEARGQEAVFDLANETIELMGQPVLIDKQKGKIQGDKLTFYMADDRIVVENEGRERSETVIKS